MRSREQIVEAAKTLQIQAELLDQEGSGDSLAAQCCWATLGLLSWVMEDGTSSDIDFGKKLAKWRAEYEREGTRLQRPGLQ